MNRPDMPADPEFDLPKQALAMRSLARVLVGAEDADDLVQEVALQVLVARPPAGTWLPAWLNVVMRRRASNRRRAAHRRTQRERAVAAGPVDPAADPSQAAAHREALTVLTKALVELPEPYRDTLFQRFFQDRTPTAIAASAGVPLATVKSRLQRGLQLLRERVAAGLGGDWRPAVATAFGLGEAATHDVLRMPPAKTASLALGATMLLTGGVWLAFELRTAAAVSVAPVAAPAVARAPGAAATADAVVVPPLAVERGVAAAPFVEPVAPSRVSGRCIDPSGRPLAGVEYRFRAAMRSPEREWTRYHDVPEPIERTGRTDGDGRFVIEYPPQPQLHLTMELHGAGLVKRVGGFESRAGAGADLGDLVLVRGTRLMGRVVDRLGVPQPDVVVDLWRDLSDAELDEQLRLDDGAVATTQSDGWFAFDVPLPAGDYQLEIDERRGAAPTRVLLDGSDSVRVLELVVEPVAVGMRLCGVVVDEHGAPVPGAQVKTDRLGSAICDQTGRFRLARPEGAPDAAALRVDVDGFEIWRGPELFTWGRDDVRIVLAGGLRVDVAVVTGTGVPVTTFQVRVEVLGDDGRHRETRTLAPGAHPGGVCSVTLRRGAHLLRVEPRDRSLEASTFVPLTLTGSMPVPLRVIVPEAGERRVRVQFADGRPVADAAVQLLDPVGASEVPASEVDIGDRPLVRMSRPLRSLAIAEACTGADGTALLRGPAGVSFAVAVRGGSQHLGALANGCRLGDPEPLVVTVSRGGSILGRIGPAEAIARLRTMAHLPPEGPWDDGAPRVQLRRDDTGAFAAVSREASGRIVDGTYTVDGLLPGSWELGIEWTASVDGRVSMRGWQRLTSVVVVEGEAKVLDLDLRPIEPGELRGIVRHNGVPLANEELTLGCVDGFGRDGRPNERHSQVRTDAQGRLVHYGLAGSYWLEWYGHDSMIQSAEKVELAAGRRTDVEFTLATGELRLRLLTADGEPVRGVEPDFVDPKAGFVYVHQTATDEHGWLTVTLQAGTHTVSVYPRQLMTRAAQRDYEAAHERSALRALVMVLATIPLAPGERVERELRLPHEWARDVR